MARIQKTLLDVPATISEFMDRWEASSMVHHTALIVQFLKLYETDFPVTVEALMEAESYPGKKRYSSVEKAEAAIAKSENIPYMIINLKNEIRYTALRKWEERVGMGTYSIVAGCAWRPENLPKLIHAERIAKEQDFLLRIMKITGTIIDTNLYVGHDGNINGTARGIIGTASVTTIFAGGYNIQCLHFRVLVKKYAIA